MIKVFFKKVHLRRLGQPKNIAGAFALADSGEVSYITGVVPHVYGIISV